MSNTTTTHMYLNICMIYQNAFKVILFAFSFLIVYYPVLSLSILVHTQIGGVDPQPNQQILISSTVVKGFATFWEFSFYKQKKVANYEYHSLFAEKNHFHT